MTYTIVYRNSLKYCNYKCEYCPFSKYKINEEKIKRDKKLFQKFVDFMKNSNEEFKVFLAPKGEVLNFEHYKSGIIELCSLSNIKEVVVQTNLSGDLSWLYKANKEKLILWTTYHPTEVKLQEFIEKVKQLCEIGIDFTVGFVGIKENLEYIKKLKLEIDNFGDKKPYLWINAYKDVKNYYSKEDIKEIENIDPLYHINMKNYSSRSVECKAGDTVFWVEGNGLIHRCYKDNVILGNLYKGDLNEIRKATVCKNNICTCFMGYINIKNLNLENHYNKSLLGRMP
ncbi:STM4011 family radical SAM protein [Clostridium sp. UBA6640]|uniref:STM4011 family radical SAM protein n=1 Tax=Clostridium sp. UBA6640 TaxID=1946370 RepID=UPI0025BFA601|nr:STM4011 family radical SAM protein [Clostridium sp. UBA6640]